MGVGVTLLGTTDITWGLIGLATYRDDLGQKLMYCECLYHPSFYYVMGGQAKCWGKVGLPPP